MRTRRRNAPHEVTETCQADHCHSHDLDEPAVNPYLVCGECFHTFRTARELRRTHIAEHRALLRRDWRRPRVLVSAISGDPFGTGGMTRPTRLELVWLWLTAGLIRARSIYFCPHCVHDF